MPRYIDADLLAEMIQAKADTLIMGKEAFLYVAKWLDYLPAADVVPKSNWISVKDRLPEKNTRVLCYFKFEPESPDVISENTYHSGGLWLSEGSKVTHWMPLPEPPKKGGAEE